MNRFILLGLALLSGVWGGCGREEPELPDWGVDLTYQILYPDAVDLDRENLAHRVKDVLAKRAQRIIEGETYVVVEPEVTLQGDDRVTVRLPGIDRSTVGKWKPLLSLVDGRVEVYALAEKEIQENYNRDNTITEDYRAFGNVPASKRSRASEDVAWSGDVVLVRFPPISRDARVRTERGAKFVLTGDGQEWVISVDFDMESSKRIHDASKRLIAENPPGRLAIVIDGELHSTPRVSIEGFKGWGLFSFGDDEEKAGNLGFAFWSGRLPVWIGKRIEGSAVPGEPESETYYGKAKDSKAPPPGKESE